MSEEHSVPVPVPTTTRRRRWLVPALVLGLLLAVGGGIGAWRLRGEDGPSYPAAWDPKVLPYVEIVEKHRDLKFLHPIQVDFLAEAEFEVEVQADEGELTDEDRREIEQATGLFRAIGLLEGEVDLFEQINELSGAGTIGFYSYDDKRIRLKGSDLSPIVEQTLVHELTHALQDQHFDLAATNERFEDSDEDGESVFEAIVEGDANRIEAKYREDLSKADLAALAKAEEEQSKDFDGRAKDIPEILQTFMGAPYALGEQLLGTVILRHGEGAIDDLFEDPPTHDEQLLDPWTLDAEDDVFEISEIEPGDGEEPLGDEASGEFGAVTWYLMLAERIPLAEALEATDGWAGDTSLAFQRDGLNCVRAAWRGDEDADVEQMRTALERWIAAAPGSPASVVEEGEGLVFESCDPGADQQVGQDRSREALTLQIQRSAIAATVAEGTGRKDFARCYANGVVRVFSVDQLMLDKLTPEMNREIQGVVRDCQ